MTEVESFALRVNQNKTGFEVRLQTSAGSIELSLSPEVAGNLALALVRSGAESGEHKLAQVAQPFVVEDANFRMHQGQLVLVQELQGGIALTSNMDQQKLLDLELQIEQLLAGTKPPTVQ